MAANMKGKLYKMAVNSVGEGYSKAACIMHCLLLFFKVIQFSLVKVIYNPQ